MNSAETAAAAARRRTSRDAASCPPITFLRTEFAYVGVDDDGRTFSGTIAGVTVTVVEKPDNYTATAVHGQFSCVGHGRNLVECEENLRKEIGQLQARMAILAIYVQAPSDAACAMDQFARRWGSLPPLVRASLSYAMAEHCARGAIAQKARIESLSKAGVLLRRARVDSFFMKAGMVCHDLFVSLCTDADAAAEERGIDLDVAYTNQSDMHDAIPNHGTPKKSSKQQRRQLGAVQVGTASRRAKKIAKRS